MKKHPKNKNKIRKRFVIESIALFIIVISPFIFKLHEYLPQDPEATITIFGFIIDSNGFLDLNTYGWFLLGKIVPLILLFIWFLTCKHWWYHIILIPITMYAFQIFEVLYSSDRFVDTRNILWLLPVCMVVIPFVYFIRIKLYDKYVHGIDLEAMEAEISILKETRIKPTKVESTTVSTKTPEEIGYLSLSEKIDRELSTDNLESKFRQFQNQLNNWIHLRF